MEMLKGLDLAAMVKRHGPQSEERVVGILLQASHAVAEAYGSGLVHRDLKPANVMVAGWVKRSKCPAGAAAFAAALEATGIRPWTAVQARAWWAEHDPAI